MDVSAGFGEEGDIEWRGEVVVVDLRLCVRIGGREANGTTRLRSTQHRQRREAALLYQCVTSG